MRDLKKYTSRQIRQRLQQEVRTELLEKIEYNKNKQYFKVWQTRYDAVVIRYSSVLETKMKYIHDNPVKAKLVEEDWQWTWGSAGWYKGKLESKIALRHAADIMY
ncbi:MAG: hypothetical protein JNJ85_06690 [Candidatus Kapabacteria bacterium]|nr:hypothetical protein [Candidatus Kapabacteria bacterium]